MQSHKTPCKPKFSINRLVDDNDKISVDDQKLLSSGIRMMSYLMKHSMPDITNATWELSKDMDDANPAAFLEIHHVMKYALDKKNLGL